MTKKKNVLLKDCFTYEDLISIHSALEWIVDYCRDAHWSPEYIEKRIRRLEELKKIVLAATVHLMHKTDFKEE